MAKQGDVYRKRDVATTIRMTPEEMEMLRALAEAMGLSQSDVIRQFIRREHERRFPGKKAKG